MHRHHAVCRSQSVQVHGPFLLSFVYCCILLVDQSPQASVSRDSWPVNHIIHDTFSARYVFFHCFSCWVICVFCLLLFSPWRVSGCDSQYQHGSDTTLSCPALLSFRWVAFVVLNFLRVSIFWVSFQTVDQTGLELVQQLSIDSDSGALSLRMLYAFTQA